MCTNLIHSNQLKRAKRCRTKIRSYNTCGGVTSQNAGRKTFTAKGRKGKERAILQNCFLLQCNNIGESQISVANFIIINFAVAY